MVMHRMEHYRPIVELTLSTSFHREAKRRSSKEKKEFQRKPQTEMPTNRGLSAHRADDERHAK